MGDDDEVVVMAQAQAKDVAEKTTIRDDGDRRGGRDVVVVPAAERRRARVSSSSTPDADAYADTAPAVDASSEVPSRETGSPAPPRREAAEAVVESSSSRPASSSSSSSYSYTFREEVLACRFDSWYETFRSCRRRRGRGEGQSLSSGDGDGDGGGAAATIRSVVLPLPTRFVEYLLSDGVVLPRGANVSSCAAAGGGGDAGDAGDDGGDDDATSWSTSSSSTADRGDPDPGDRGRDGAPPSSASSSSSSDDDNDHHNRDDEFAFPEFDVAISDAIRDLGGSVLPKLNWSAPRDAVWVNEGTMRCRKPGDVYVLLKSSDFVVHDLLHAFDDDRDGSNGDDNGGALVAGGPDGFEYKLVLRKWCQLHRSMEFRCFVARDRLVAISQRDHTQCYPHLGADNDDERVRIREIILRFFVDVVRPNFPLSNYVFDCYVDQKGRSWLIDFNVWGARTDPLLFDWDELDEVLRSVETEGDAREGGGGGNVVDSSSTTDDDFTNYDDHRRPEFRIVENDREVRCDPLSSYRAPIDAVDLAGGGGGGGGIAGGGGSPLVGVPAGGGGGGGSFAEFMAMCQKPSSV